MKTGLIAAGLILLSGGSAFAHRLDEYLQATTISLEQDRIEAQIRLTPGVAVFPLVMAAIDTNDNGVISAEEQQAYAQRVLSDLSITVHGDRLTLQPVSTKFPTTDEMKEGLGEIKIDFTARLRRESSEHRLSFENHHQKAIAAYLVNCLAPRNPNIRITAQRRNYDQSLYQVDYLQDSVRSSPLSLSWWSGGPAFLGSVAILILARLALLLRRQHI